MEELLDTAPVAADPGADGRRWPQVGQVRAAGQGTGFVAGPGVVLTARHLLDADEAEFELDGVAYAARLALADPALDAALLGVEAPDAAPLPPPLLPCELPPLPVSFMAWGYRDAGRGSEALFGFGQIVARPSSGVLQLHTLSQRPGMSGAPLVVRTAGGLRVVGIGNARHRADAAADVEGLAFGVPIAALAPEIRDRLPPILPAPPPARARVEEAALRLLSARHRSAARFRRASTGAVVLLAAFALGMAATGTASRYTVPVLVLLLAASVVLYFLFQDHRDAADEAALVASVLAFSGREDADAARVLDRLRPFLG